MGKIYVVGLGPGDKDGMTLGAYKVLEESDVIIGYTVYVKLIEEMFKGKEILSTGMRQEKDRCLLCFEKAGQDKTVSLVCSGDAGVYGMASLLLELATDFPKTEIEIIPGVTAALSGNALLGSPISGDFCVISLSDNLTPWEVIERRLRGAAISDFVIAIYNPRSKARPKHLSKACEILMEYIEGERVCGVAQNIGRENEESFTCSLRELKDSEIDMFTTVFIGNSETRLIGGKLVTPRGYIKNDE